MNGTVIPPSTGVHSAPASVLADTDPGPGSASAAAETAPAPGAGAPAGLERLGDAARELLAADQPLREALLAFGLQAAWLIGAFLAGLLIHLVLFAVLRVVFRRRVREAQDEDERREERTVGHVVARLSAPARWVLVLLALLFVINSGAPFGDATRAVLRHLVAILLIGSATWLLVRLMSSTIATLLTRYDLSTPDNLRARKVHTQFRVFARIAATIFWVLGIAAMLMTFPGVRQLGASLLASAGIAGLVIGLAAQRVIGNFLAGIQIAVSQPVRLDDAVVIAGEWGWVEEITATYVVVRIWDQRRLIVPFSTLLEQPFQNWTRTSADLIGSVILHTDYRVPLAPLREELKRALADAGDLWDGRVSVLQVIDATPETLQLRALVSARSSPAAWDLRCFVRERLVDFLQREHPYALPLSRVALRRGAGADEAPAPVSARAAPPPALEEVGGGLPGAPEEAPEEQVASEPSGERP